jgi:hypothetical protein
VFNLAIPLLEEEDEAGAAMTPMRDAAMRKRAVKRAIVDVMKRLRRMKRVDRGEDLKNGGRLPTIYKCYQGSLI